MASKNQPVARQYSAAEVNMLQRNAVLQSALEQELNIFSQRFTPPVSGAPGSTINIPLRNVGLVKKFIVLFRAKVHSTATEVQTLQPFGPANFLSYVQLTDLQNQTRINTTGWHLHNIATAKRQSIFGGAYSNDSPTTIGNNFAAVRAPAALSSTTPQDVYMAYEIPVSYSDTDLRGAIYANVVNATWNLALTINPNLFVSSTANGVGAMYKSATGVLGVMDYFDIEVYQVFLDQLPVTPQGVLIYPELDTSIMYRLESTVQTALVPNQELAVPFANFRKFLSTMVVYDNNGILNPGTDVNYFGMQTANTTNLFKRSPHKIAVDTRNLIGDDFQPGVYYFDHRRRPVETSQFGNVQLTFNVSQVNSAVSQMLLGYEYLAEANVITQAGSIQN